MIARWAGVALALAACAPELPAPSVTFHPDADGLEVRPSGLRVDFGRAPSGVIPVLDRSLGAHRSVALRRCPEEIVQHLAWGDLVLSFTAHRFVGWRQGVDSAGQVCG
ncbi:MAG: hypothetical protein CSA73_00095 [Rhodobacterales bacterium]|nr:MAG: hypothetical protein CSA73_00095 [Rhodobacterales bacterium]